MSEQASTDESATGAGEKYLTFELRGEEYAIHIARVQEILGLLPITVVPKTPQFVRGVVNLRGKIIPIVDLRLKFGMEQADDTPNTCIIVVRAQGVDMGVVVDAVSEVLTIPDADIDDPPQFGDAMNTDFLKGMGKTGGKVRLLLDIERVLSGEEVVQLPGVQGQ